MTYSPPPPPLPSRFSDDDLVVCVNCGAPTDPAYVKCKYCGKDMK